MKTLSLFLFQMQGQYHDLYIIYKGNSQTDQKTDDLYGRGKTAADHEEYDNCSYQRIDSKDKRIYPV